MSKTSAPCHPYVQELRETARLAVPLALAFAGTQTLSLVDMIVAGAVGERTLAAAGLGQAVFFIATVAPVGLMMGLEPLVNQALGRGAPGDAHRAGHSGRLLGRWVSAAAMALGLGLTALALTLMELSAAVRTETWSYSCTRLLGVWPLLAFVCRRSMLQGWGRTRPIAMAIIVGNLVNLPASALLGAGDEALILVGLPELGLGPGLGAGGIGLASTIVAIVQALWLARASAHLPDRPQTLRASWTSMLPLLRVGWPIGLQMAAAVGVFCGMTLAMGAFGETAIAAHQIALTVTSMTFTLCLGIGSATSVRVGRATGAGRVAAARRAAVVGLTLGSAVMIGCAGIMVSSSRQIAACFTDAPQVAALAAELLVIAAVFQVFDGLQSIAGGGLRGAGDTRAAMVLGVIGYWGLGMPLALVLASGVGLGPRGLWFGLLAGLVFSGLALPLRLVVITRARETVSIR